MDPIQAALNSDEIPWEFVELKRGDYLIRAGEHEQHLSFVQEGALRAYTLKGDEEFTIRFAYTGSIAASIPAYFSDEASDVSIQAIRHSKLLRTHKRHFEAFMSKTTERLLTYNQLLKELMATFYEREVDLLTSSPAERLERVRKRSPQLFQEVPHKYIASYLRMSPETLSRMLKS